MCQQACHRSTRQAAHRALEATGALTQEASALLMKFSDGVQCHGRDGWSLARSYELVRQLQHARLSSGLYKHCTCAVCSEMLVSMRKVLPKCAASPYDNMQSLTCHHACEEHLKLDAGAAQRC
jgi:hypothetical protein